MKNYNPIMKRLLISHYAGDPTAMDAILNHTKKMSNIFLCACPNLYNKDNVISKVLVNTHKAVVNKRIKPTKSAAGYIYNTIRNQIKNQLISEEGYRNKLDRYSVRIDTGESDIDIANVANEEEWNKWDEDGWGEWDGWEYHEDLDETVYSMNTQ